MTRFGAPAPDLLFCCVDGHPPGRDPGETLAHVPRGVRTESVTTTTPGKSQCGSSSLARPRALSPGDSFVEKLLWRWGPGVARTDRGPQRPSPALRTPRGSNTARSVLFPGAVCVSSSLGQARPERVDFARGAAMRLLGSSDKQTPFCPLAVALELEDLGSSLGVAPS